MLVSNVRKVNLSKLSTLFLFRCANSMEYPRGISAAGNGDCLFNSVGKLLFGTEAVTPILRLLSITDAIGHVDHYIEEVQSLLLRLEICFVRCFRVEVLQ